MRLIDCFRDLLAYARSSADRIADGESLDYEKVRTEIDRGMAKAESCGRDGRYPADLFDDAKFAAAAYVDEVLLTCNWSEAGHWQRESIQFREFNTNNAGVEFFDRLDALSPVNPAEKDVREVYATCLAMGYKGRFYSAGEAAALANKTVENLKLVAGEDLVDGRFGDEGLFPGSRIQPRGGGGLRIRGYYRTLYYGLPVLILIAAFYFLRGWVIEAADALLAVL